MFSLNNLPVLILVTYALPVLLKLLFHYEDIKAENRIIWL